MLGRGSSATILLLALVAAACNATGDVPGATARPTASPTASSAPAISTPVDLRGTWTADVQGTTASSGMWTMLISDSNVSLQNPVGGDPFTLDPISMSDAGVTFPAAADCPDQSAVTEGSYTFTLDGETLRIVLTSDSCGDRSAVLVAAPWKRKG
ncbi:MAG: hypothetical protein ABI573_06685 [Chloroflexota bacterium]